MVSIPATIAKLVIVRLRNGGGPAEPVRPDRTAESLNGTDLSTRPITILLSQSVKVLECDLWILRSVIRKFTIAYVFFVCDTEERGYIN